MIKYTLSAINIITRQKEILFKDANYSDISCFLKYAAITKQKNIMICLKGVIDNGK